MTEKLSAQLEYAAHENFGSIVGSFVLDSMPDIYEPDVAPAEFIKNLVGIQLPVRAKLNHLYDANLSLTHTVADSLLDLQTNGANTIQVYGMDALTELENMGRGEVADKWDRYGWMKLGFTASQGTLAPLPRLLAA